MFVADSLWDDLVLARRARALTQHHDSLAGTMATNMTHPSFPVLDDYVNHLDQAVNASFHVMSNTLAMLATKVNTDVPQLTGDVNVSKE